MSDCAHSLGLKRINNSIESLKTDGDQVEDRADGGDILEVEDDLAHHPAEGPDEGEEGDELDRETDDDDQEVCGGEVGEEGVGGGATE